MRLSLEHYFGYLNASFSSRCVKEGEEILNANHLILCGSTKSNSEQVHVYALCLQTSSLNELPHVIQGILEIKSSSVQVQRMVCSCKAGAGEKCKHVSAVLLYCTRYSITEFELISQTDLKCVWALKKQASLEQYKPVPLLETNCFKSNNETLNLNKLSSEEEEVIRLQLEKSCPNSALTKHRIGRSKSGNIPLEIRGSVGTDTVESHATEIINNAVQSIIMMELCSVHYLMLDCCREMYEKLFSKDVSLICSDTKISNTAWQKERKFRITGSRCYSIFTFQKSEWEKKAVGYFWPKPFSNVYVKHGIYFEESARQKYNAKTGSLVETTGFIVANSNTWLGYSPDGIVMENNKPVKLLEIKCPFIGKTKSIKECFKGLPFLQRGTTKLKTKHAYYAQIQFGMAVLNLPECDFVIYSSFDDEILIINVKFDLEYASSLMITLKRRFYENMLHRICENKMDIEN